MIIAVFLLKIKGGLSNLEAYPKLVLNSKQWNVHFLFAI